MNPYVHHYALHRQQEAELERNLQRRLALADRPEAAVGPWDRFRARRRARSRRFAPARIAR